MVLLASTPALAGVEPPEWTEPDRVPGPPAPMPADEDVPTVVTGTGGIREARALLVDGRYTVAVQTAAGPSSVTLALGHDLGFPEHTLTRMELRDVVGDGDAELYLELGWYHDPCGCDDGPTFSSTEVIVCRLGNARLSCSQPVAVAGSEHVLERRSWRAELTIDRSGLARRTVTEREGLGRGEARRLERPVRLRFRQR